MILIADAGASKTDWRLIGVNDEIEQYQTIGFNPYYQDVEMLERELLEMLIPQLPGEITTIYYYGTGLGSDGNRKLIRQSVQKLFPDCHIEIWHDLLAAARALCGSETGIVCILGTGANSCLYDGNKIIDNVSSLAYILGDEGSGAHLGKQLVADYLRKDMPEVIWDRFLARFNTNREEILDRVYNQEMPGRFLASFAKFIFQNIKDPYCYKLVYDSFKVFFEKNVIKYEAHKDTKIHFTGSIAFYFSNILRQVGNDLGLHIGHIVESPIAGLTLFHQNELLKK